MRPRPDPAGPGQESVWDFPRPAIAQPIQVRIRIEHRGRTIADTCAAVRTLETSHPPSYYIPRIDIAPDVLRRAEGSSFCEWKGAATYWDVVVGEVGDLVLPRVGWSYANPTADFHLSDHDFSELFGRAAQAGYRGYKIKVGHPDVERDLHRLDLLKKATGDDGRPVMVDANETWTAAEAQAALALFARAGHRIFWIEDPTPRDDFDGLRRLRLSCPETRVNSGEYLDLSGKRRLLEAKACDMLNLHGQISDVMRAGWLAGEHNVEVTFGNSFLELGVNTALALPGVRWLEYSFQNFDHLVESPYPIRDGLIYGHRCPGHGLRLDGAARQTHHTPEPLTDSDLPPAPCRAA